MILVVQVKDIKTFCKLPQNEALQNMKPIPVASSDTVMSTWARILHYLSKAP